MRLFSPRPFFRATAGCGWLLAAVFLLGAGHAGAQIPPQFSVPGEEVEMKALNELHALHAKTAFSDCTLWDVWLPHATLWTGQTAAYRTSFLKRRMDAVSHMATERWSGVLFLHAR
jgi:hypothetical protein